MARTITLRISGSDADDLVRLGDFINQLAALKDALNHTERLLVGSEGSVDYRIIKLSQNSPAMVTVEAVPRSAREDVTEPVVRGFFGYLRAIERDDPAIRAQMDLTALEAFKNLAPTKKRRISELRISDAETDQRITRSFALHVQKVIGPDELTEGSVVGALEMINLHNQPRFAIFETIKNRKVTCTFEPQMKAEIIAALEKYVRVTGTLHYKKWDPRPHEVEVKTLEVFPEERDLPTLLDLAGINPDIVGDMEPEEFIAEARRHAQR